MKNQIEQMALATLKNIDDANMRDNLIWHLRKFANVDKWNCCLVDNLQMTQEEYDYLGEHYYDLCDHRI